MPRSPRALVGLVSALCLLSVTTTFGTGSAVADPPTVGTCANFYAAPPLAHPGRTRWIYLHCSSTSAGALYPTAVTIDQPAHGAVLKGTMLSYLYTPQPGYEGTDHFALHLTGDGGTWPDVGYDVHVSSTEDTAPQCGAGGGSLDVRTGESRPISFGGCFDDEGDPLTYVVAPSPAHGALGPMEALPGDRARASYTPGPGYTGADALAYHAEDDFGQSSGARTVSITVHDAVFNRAPGCGGGVLPPGFPGFPGLPGLDAVHGTTTLSTGCSDLDADPLAFTIITPPTHGSVTADPATNAFVYRADGGYTGPDSWAFTVSDGHGGSTSAVRTVDVVPGHDPVCQDLLLDVAAPGAPTTAALPCSDADGDQILPEIVSAPKHGTLTWDLPYQRLTYTPAPGASETDTATYRAADDHAGLDATVHTLTFRVGGAGAPADTATGDSPAEPHPTQTDQPPAREAPAGPPAPADHGAALAAALTPAQQAARLLRTPATPFALGFGTTVQGFLARGAVRPGHTAAAVYCRLACTLQVDGRLALTGAHTAGRPGGLRLARRTLRLKAGQVGAVKLLLSGAQRARLAKARRASVVLTFTTQAGGATHSARRTLTLGR